MGSLPLLLSIIFPVIAHVVVMRKKDRAIVVRGQDGHLRLGVAIRQHSRRKLNDDCEKKMVCTSAPLSDFICHYERQSCQDAPFIKKRACIVTARVVSVDSSSHHQGRLVCILYNSHDKFLMIVVIGFGMFRGFVIVVVVVVIITIG